MTTTTFKTLMMSTAIAAGLAIASPTFAQQSRAERNREAALEAQGSNNRISYDDLTPAVRDALDRERGERKIASVYRADRGDRSWFSVVIETRRGERVIRLSPKGYVLSVGDLTEEEVRVFKADPDRWYKDYLDRQTSRAKVYTRNVDRVTATGDHPERVEWDRMPARIRATILRENYGEKPQNDVVRYRERDQVVYQINLQDGPGRQHMIKVLADGSIFEEGDFDSGGKFISGALHPKTIQIEDTPRAVRATVDREAPKGQIAHVDVMERNGRNVYTIEIDSRTETRYLTVKEDGRVVADNTDKY